MACRKRGRLGMNPVLYSSTSNIPPKWPRRLQYPSRCSINLIGSISLINFPYMCVMTGPLNFIFISYLGISVGPISLRPLPSTGALIGLFVTIVLPYLSHLIRPIKIILIPSLWYPIGPFKFIVQSTSNDHVGYFIRNYFFIIWINFQYLDQFQI